LKEQEKQRAKRIELSVDLLLEDNSIYFSAQEDLEGLFIDQINFMFMNFDALPNMYEDVLVNFSNMDLYGQVVSKNYHVAHTTLYINLELKLEE
jgi:hypothetical protein